MNDFETGEIMYVPQIVVNNIGYVWRGSEAESGAFEFGGQVTLNSATTVGSLVGLALSTYLAIMF